MEDKKNFLDLKGLSIYDELIKSFIISRTQELDRKIQEVEEMNTASSWNALGSDSPAAKSPMSWSKLGQG